MNALRLSRLLPDQRGAAAVEFALLAVPLLIFLFGIFEVGMIYFVNTAFDSAMQRSSRLIRTGQAQSQSMTLQGFRDATCDNFLNLFGCKQNSFFDVGVVSTLHSVAAPTVVNTAGAFLNTQSFNDGGGSDFIIARGYLKFTPLFNIFGVFNPPLADGTYLFGTTVMFRNEPF